MNHPQIQVCYLCGKPIRSDQSDDHVPPKQFFPRDARKGLSPNLTTLLAHRPCNQAYQSDEDYFVQAIGASQRDTPALNLIWSDISRALQRPQGRGLGLRVHSEFSNRTPAGIIMPPGMVVKTYDSDRVYRIIWKMVRGLHLKEFSAILPEDTIHRIQMITDASPDEMLQAVVNEPSREPNFPGIFDYKFKEYEIGHPRHKAMVWGLLIWDRFIFIILHHTVDCACHQCERTITKADLAYLVADELGLTHTQAMQAVDTVIEGLTNAIIKTNRIEIRGFGVWSVRETSARPNARNPRTGETVDIPARRKVIFKPGKILKKELSKSIELLLDNQTQ